MKLKKLGVFLVFLQMTFLSFSQEEVKRTHLGFSVVPQFTRFHFQTDLVEDNAYQFNYAVSGNLFFDLGQKAQFITGLTFQKINISYTDYALFFPDDVVDGEFDPTLSYWIFDYADYFLGVPLEFKFKLNRPEAINHFFLIGGLRVQYLLGNSGDVQLVESGHVWEERDFDSFYFDENRIWSILSGGVGYKFKVGQRKCFINPLFEYSLTKIFKDELATDSNGYSTSFGIRVAYY